VQKQQGVDEKITEEDGVGVVSVTFQRSDGSTVDISVTYSWQQNISTRRSIAALICSRIRARLLDNQLPENWCKCYGSWVVMTHTPKGVGWNTGTNDNPKVSPPGADHNSTHTETKTTDKNGQ
jgi:hypothetical protein